MIAPQLSRRWPSFANTFFPLLTTLEVGKDQTAMRLVTSPRRYRGSPRKRTPAAPHKATTNPIRATQPFNPTPSRRQASLAAYIPCRASHVVFPSVPGMHSGGHASMASTRNQRAFCSLAFCPFNPSTRRAGNTQHGPLHPIETARRSPATK